MKLDELLKQLTTLPPESEVVVNVGDAELDILAVAGLDTPTTDGKTAVLSLDGGDVRDHLHAIRIAG